MTLWYKKTFMNFTKVVKGDIDASKTTASLFLMYFFKFIPLESSLKGNSQDYLAPLCCSNRAVCLYFSLEKSTPHQDLLLPSLIEPIMLLIL